MTDWTLSFIMMGLTVGPSTLTPHVRRLRGWWQPPSLIHLQTKQTLLLPINLAETECCHSLARGFLATTSICIMMRLTVGPSTLRTEESAAQVAQDSMTDWSLPCIMMVNDEAINLDSTCEKTPWSVAATISHLYADQAMGVRG